MQAWFVAIGFVVISLFAGDALAATNAPDISWSDKACCCKAGCPDGSYFCQAMCQLLGGSCSLRGAGVPEGAALTIREKCTGASWSFWSGLTCPATCPANSGS